MSNPNIAALLQRAGQHAERMRADGQGFDAQLVEDLIAALKTAIGKSTREGGSTVAVFDRG